MDGVTIRPVNRDAVVLALRAVYDRQPRVFRLTSGQRRAIARVGTSPSRSPGSARAGELDVS